MLKEYKSIRQNDSEYRRLFRDEQFELYVFYEREGVQMSGFQLIRNELPSARVLTWDTAKGLHFYRMRGGERDFSCGAPVMMPAVELDTADMVRDFSAAAGGIDRDVFDSVVELLRNHRFSREG